MTPDGDLEPGHLAQHGARRPQAFTKSWVGFSARASNPPGTPHALVGGMKHAISWFALALVAVACGGNDKPAEGPAERTGEKMDEAADDVEREAEKAGDKMEQAGDKVEEKVEKERKED
jgi:hypothetical protein